MLLLMMMTLGCADGGDDNEHHHLSSLRVSSTMLIMLCSRLTAKNRVKAIYRTHVRTYTASSSKLDEA